MKRPENNGKTWSVLKVLFAGTAAYSDITITGILKYKATCHLTVLQLKIILLTSNCFITL
jgi:hypothetical protein